MIMQNDFYPAIIFSFGKRECENNALQMGKVTLNNGKLFSAKKNYLHCSCLLILNMFYNFN